MTLAGPIGRFSHVASLVYSVRGEVLVRVGLFFLGRKVSARIRARATYHDFFECHSRQEEKERKREEGEEQDRGQLRIKKKKKTEVTDHSLFISVSKIFTYRYCFGIEFVTISSHMVVTVASLPCAQRKRVLQLGKLLVRVAWLFFLGRNFPVLVADYGHILPLPVFFFVTFTWARGGHNTLEVCLSETHAWGNRAV